MAVGSLPIFYLVFPKSTKISEGDFW